MSSAAVSDEARFRLFDAFGSFLRHASHCRPLLVVIDHLHWADDSSLRLLKHVAPDTLGRAPDAVGNLSSLGERSTAARADRVAGADPPQLARQSASGLGLADSKVLRSPLMAPPFPRKVADAAWRLTDGNPLHLRQVSFSLRRQARRRPESSPVSAYGRIASGRPRSRNLCCHQALEPRQISPQPSLPHDFLMTNMSSKA